MAGLSENGTIRRTCPPGAHRPNALSSEDLEVYHVPLRALRVDVNASSRRVTQKLPSIPLSCCAPQTPTPA